MSPGDALVAVRSFPRRWRALFAAAGDDDTEQVLGRRMDDSPSALALAGHATDALELARERLQIVLHADDPVLAVELPPPSPVPPEAALDRLGNVCDHLAHAIEGVAASDWARPAKLDGLSVTAVDVVAAGIEEAAACLRRAESVVSAVVGHPDDD